MKKRMVSVSPLALFGLAACGGGSNGSSPSGPSPVDGVAIKGILSNAWAFLDLNGDGKFTEGEPEDYTDESGNFSLSMTGVSLDPNVPSPEIIVVSRVSSDGTSLTADASTGLSTRPDLTLKAPDGSQVVTPMTTLVAEGLSQDAVVKALGLQDIAGLQGDNAILSYNPYADGADGVVVEAKSHQVMNVIAGLSAAGTAAGLTSDAAIANALNTFVSVVQAATVGGETQEIDFTSTADADGKLGLNVFASAFQTQIESADNGLDAAGVAALKDAMLQSLSATNTYISRAAEVGGSIDDLTEYFSVVNLAISDIADAVGSGRTTDITITSPTVAAVAGASEAPSAINIKSPTTADEGVTFDADGSISLIENLQGAVVGLIDLPGEVDLQGYTFSIVDADSQFEVVKGAQGIWRLEVKDDAILDYEANATISIKLKVVNKFKKEYVQDFTINLENVDEDPEIVESAITIEQGDEFSKKLTILDPENDEIVVEMDTDSDLFEFNGTILRTSRSVTQEDVNGGDIELSFSLRDTTSGKVVFETVTVSFVNVNDAPKFTTNTIIGGTEGKAYSQKVIVTDADGDDIELSLVGAPEWLSIDADGILRAGATYTANDLNINEPISFSVKAADGNGGETLKDFVLEFENVNDAPQFTVDGITGTVVEAKDSIGVKEAVESDKLSGKLAFNDIDPGDTADNLTVELSGAGSPRADGTLSVKGVYGTLVYDPSNYSYVYTPNEVKIEPLHAETVTDVFTFKLYDDDGASDTLNLTVNITGADDNPRVADAADQEFITLGNNQFGTIIGDVNILDGSEGARAVLAAASTANDNDKFEIVDGQLKLLDDVATNYAVISEYTVQIYAQDVDATGSADPSTKSETKTFTIRVSAEDPAPQIVAIDTNYSGQPLSIGEELDFTVTLSEKASAGGTTTMTLNNGARVTLSVGDVDSQILTGTYEVIEGQTDATESKPLEVSSIISGTITDFAEQGLIEQTSFDDLGGILVDANAPSAKLLGSEDNPHTYDPSTGKLVLQGTGLGTLITGASRDVSNALDWTKLTWNIDGEGSTTLALNEDADTGESYVTSAIVNSDGTKLTVQLSAAGMSELHSLASFGGVEASGGLPDTLNVSAGFLRDFAGNASTASSTPATEVFITDQTAPELESIEIYGAFTSTAVSGRSSGATFVVGDTLTYTATIAEASDLANLANMQVSLTLSNNKQLKLVRDQGADGSVKTFSASYIISEDDDDVAKLSLKNYSLNNIKDIAGNAASTDKLLSDVTKVYSGVAVEGSINIDATAPAAQILGTDDLPHTYDAVSGTLILQGLGLNTIQAAVDDYDVLDIVNWRKLTWNVDGEGAITHQMSKADVSSAVVNADGTALTINLSPKGMVALHDLDGFGGTDATGGVRDALQVAAGFLRDSAGNLSTLTSTAVSEVALDDNEALVLDSISFASAPGARMGQDSILEFQAIFSDLDESAATIGTELADDAELVLTLNNGVNVTLTKSVVAGEGLVLVGQYQVDPGDDTVDADGDINLEVVSVDADGVFDVAGNQTDGTGALAKVDLGDGVIIDTIAPALDQLVYNSSSQELVFVFKELLDAGNITANKTAIIGALDGVSAVEATGNNNTTFTATLDAGVEFSQGQEFLLDTALTFEDLAGNEIDIYSLTIGAVISDIA